MKNVGLAMLAWTLLCGVAVAQDDLDELLGISPGEERPSDEEVSSPPEDGEKASGGGDSEPREAPSEPSVERPVVSEEATPPAPSARTRVIEEIVVTAQKKEQSLQDVPISMTALTGEFLKDAGIDDMHQLVEFTPNVRFTSHTTVFVRGMGSPFSTGTFDPAVGLALDELSIPRETYMADPIYDIERFEVLRGPQGTLFGKNTPAGLFNVVTGSPTNDFTGYLIGRIGGLGLHRVEAALGGPLGPLGDLARFRLAVVETRQEGDVENTLLGWDEPATKQRAGRLKLAVQPLPDLNVLLIGEIAKTETRFFHLQQHDLPDDSVRFLRRFDPAFEDDGFDHQNSQNFRNLLDRDTDRLQGNVSYALGDLGPVRETEIVAVTGVTGFDQAIPLDIESTPADLVNIVPPAALNYDQRSAEFRFSGLLPAPFRFGEVEFLAGVLVFDSDILSNSPVEAGSDFDEYLLSPAAFELVTGEPAPGGVGFADLASAASALGVNPVTEPSALEGDGARFFLDQDTKSQAVFGQAAWHLTDRWTLSLGARVTFEQKEALAINECFDPGLVCAALGAEEFERNLERDETDFSPKVTLQFFPFEDLTLFATRAEGFKSGGFNNFSFTADGIEVGPETAVSWEVGGKGSLFAGSLNWSGTFFHMDIDDLQLQNLVGTLVTVRNAASARTRGFEFDFRWLTPWEPLSIQGAGSITDADFKSFPDAPAPVTSDEPAQDLSGRRMPFVPERQLNVTPELRFPFRIPVLPWIGDVFRRDLVFTTAFDVLHRSNMYLDSDLDPNTLQDAYAMLDARLRLSTADEALSLGVNVDNVTDADVWEFAADTLLFPRGYRALQEFQRNVSVELRYNW